jgi:hypothetical protein
VRLAGYRARVQATSLNRWAVVILLVIRLILGEFAHAHDGAHAAASTASQESSHCHDDAKQPSKSDCCKTGGCDCPCPFGAAVARDVTFFLALTAEVTASGSFLAATPDRPFTLFRPPA